MDLGRLHFLKFYYFSQKIRFDVLGKFSPMETICIKCQIIFSLEKKKKKKKNHKKKYKPIRLLLSLARE